MECADWELVDEIYQWASQVPTSERREFVADACKDNPSVAQEVHSLLVSKESPNVFAGASDLVGETVAERYRVERELAEGGMGKVYVAVDLHLPSRRVIIKVLTQKSLNRPTLVRRFKQEAEALSRARHPRVVGVFDAGELSDGTPFIVMEYVEGETLESQIKEQGMDLEAIATILTDIGEALDHVHGKGIFHRDLKPGNIMLEGDDRRSVKIIDFGIAKVKDSVIAPGTVEDALVGTVVYMSPEHLRGEEVTAASDVYSMAVVAYEMITGHRPFDPASAPQLLEMQREGVHLKPRSRRPEVSEKAESILLRGLGFGAAARYDSAGEFAGKLARALRKERLPFIPSELLKFTASLIVLAALSFGIYKIIAKPRPPLYHHLNYWLMVQRTRDGKDYQQPTRTFGEEIFESGDKFQLNVSGPEQGYLYVFNEGPPEPNNTSFKVIYPVSTINNGSSAVGANQPIQSDWITFRGPAGAENFWLVWSLSPVSELEAAKNEAIAHGALTEVNQAAVKQFLKAKESEIKVGIARYKDKQAAVVRSTGGLLIKFVEFKHK